VTVKVNDPVFAGWNPPDYSVTPQGKVSNAKPGRWNNWSRWGDEDQVGTANLLTAERTAHAATLIRTGERYSLGLPIGIPIPGGPGGEAMTARGNRRTINRAQLLHFFASTAGDGVLGDPQAQYPVDANTKYDFSDDFLLIALQHTTQLDGFGVAIDDAMFNGYWAGLVTATSGARRLGIHHRAKGIVGRGVLLDVARHLGVERMDDRFRIGPDLLLQVAEAEGVTIGEGDILLIRTGWLGWWFEDGADAEPGLAPGVSGATIPLFAERDIAMVALDNVTAEVVDNEAEPGYRRAEFHISGLRDLGLQIGEYFNLDELAAACSEDGVYEMFFVASPLPVVGGAGSPINPLAIR